MEYRAESESLFGEKENYMASTMPNYSIKQVLFVWFFWVLLTIFGYVYTVVFKTSPTGQDTFALLEPFFHNYDVIDRIYEALVKNDNIPRVIFHFVYHIFYYTSFNSVQALAEFSFTQSTHYLVFF